MKFLFLAASAAALLGGCKSSGSRSDMEKRMQRLIRAVTEGDTRVGDRLVRSASGGPGGIEVQRVHDEYEQLKQRLSGQALAAPIPSDAATAQVIQTGVLPGDIHGLYLIEYFSLGRGNLPRLGEYRMLSPSRVEIDTLVSFHFDTLEYRRYPNHTAITLPLQPTGTIGTFNLGLARVPPRIVPGKVTLRWTFLRGNADWTMEQLAIVPGSLTWVTDERPL